MGLRGRRFFRAPPSNCRGKNPGCAHCQLDGRTVNDVGQCKCVSFFLCLFDFCQHGKDMMVMALVMVDCVLLPVQLAWPPSEPMMLDVVWLWFTTCSFVVDMILNLFTAFPANKWDLNHSPGALITDKRLLEGT